MEFLHRLAEYARRLGVYLRRFGSKVHRLWDDIRRNSRFVQRLSAFVRRLIDYARRNKEIVTIIVLLCMFAVAGGMISRSLVRRSPVPEESSAQETPIPAVQSVEREPVTLCISEVMSSNDTVVIDGLVTDWVELHNTGAKSVPLGGLYLSDTASDLCKCPLPDITVEPDGYLVLCSDRELNFRISRGGETLYLSAGPDAVVSSVSVPPMESDQSYSDETGITDFPTPGMANTEENGRRFAAPDGLYISEIMSSNGSAYAHGSDYFDWLELGNAGSDSILLSDYCLSDSGDDLPGWQLPAVTLAPGEYYVVLCSGVGGEQAPFLLSSEGEKLYLSSSGGELLSIVSVPLIPRDKSWGLSADGLVYFASATPGAANGTGCAELSAEPCASAASGFYSEEFEVTLSGSGTIRYTTDGTTPTFRSPEYKGESIPVTGSMSLRAYCQDGEKLESRVITWNYFLGEPDYTLDIVKVSIAPAKARGALAEDDSTEKFAANIALYHNGEEEFSLPCGIGVFGSGGRIYGKKSYQINFSAAYGAPALHYRLFENRSVDTYKTFALRSGSQDQAYATMRDELLTSIFDDCSDTLVTLAYRPVNLYINNEYRGVYYLRERTDEKTFAATDNCRESDVSICKNITVSYAASRPALHELSELLRFIRSKDMSDAENFAYVESKLDIDSLIDYFIAQMWSTNYDIGNARMIRTTADSGRWRFLLYDLDVAFLQPNDGSVYRMVTAYGRLLESLLKNDSFRERCTRRLGELLRGPLREEVVLDRLDAFTDNVRHDMTYNFSKWRKICTYEKWEAQVLLLREGRNIGIKGWNSELIRQYIEVVSPPDGLIVECFGEEYLPE